MDMKHGLLTWSGDPRFSNGYGDATHLPTILVENHSLKPYKRRVLGTYVLMAETLGLLAREKHSLRKATATDRQRRPDSFLQWGFFLEIFTRTEYAEAYVLEPLAQKMLASDAGLKSRFEQKLEGDEAFAGSPYQRLMWFYEQTPFYDQQYLLYPVARVPRIH